MVLIHIYMASLSAKLTAVSSHCLPIPKSLLIIS